MSIPHLFVRYSTIVMYRPVLILTDDRPQPVRDVFGVLVVQKGASLVMISTPNGAESNMFFHLWHGTPITVSQAA